MAKYVCKGSIIFMYVKNKGITDYKKEFSEVFGIEKIAEREIFDLHLSAQEKKALDLALKMLQDPVNFLTNKELCKAHKTYRKFYPEHYQWEN